MKIIKLTTLLILFFCSPLFSKTNPQENHVTVLSIKKEAFNFKVDKHFLGATIEVYNREGIMLLTKRIVKRKMSVDFYFREAGTYKIKVAKGGIIEEFEYSFGVR